MPHEVAQLALFKGDVAGLLKTLAGVHAWLGTHLADLLSHLHLPAFDLPRSLLTEEEEGDGNPDGPLGLREHFLLDWGDRCVACDPGLWRISCEYWTACGAPGRDKARELVKGMEIVAPGEEDEREKGKDAAAAAGAADGMDVEGERQKGAASGQSGAPAPGAGRRVDELLLVCASLDLEGEFVDICRRYADYLVERKRYGEAVAYAVRASDGTKVARIAELIGEEYVESGEFSTVSYLR